MSWLPTRASNIKGIEAVRLAGRGFSASNPQTTSFGTFPLELDEIIIIFLGHPLLFNTVVHFKWLHIFKQREPVFFVRSFNENIVYCSKV